MTVHEAHTRVLVEGSRPDVRVPVTRVALTNGRDVRPLQHRGARLRTRGGPAPPARGLGARPSRHRRRTTAARPS